MSLDIYLTAVIETTVFSDNITHNLGKMAAQLNVDADLTLYMVLWRPDEHGFEYARDIIYYLDAGLKELEARPEYYKKFNPENGWGEYANLVILVRDYLEACRQYPDAKIHISR